MQNIFECGYKIRSSDECIGHYNISYLAIIFFIIACVMFKSIAIFWIIPIVLGIITIYSTNNYFKYVLKSSSYTEELISRFIEEATWYEENFGRDSNLSRLKSNIRSNADEGIRSFIYYVVYRYSSNYSEDYIKLSYPTVTNGCGYDCKGHTKFMISVINSVGKIRRDEKLIRAAIAKNPDFRYKL